MSTPPLIERFRQIQREAWEEMRPGEPLPEHLAIGVLGTAEEETPTPEADRQAVSRGWGIYTKPIRTQRRPRGE